MNDVGLMKIDNQSPLSYDLKMMTDKKCLWTIRFKSTKEYFSGQHDLFRYFIHKTPIWGCTDSEYEIHRKGYVSSNPYDAVLFASERNAQKALKDATRRINEWKNGHYGLPVDECEIVAITFNIGG